MMGASVRELMSPQVRVVEPDITCLAVWEYLERAPAGPVAVVDHIGRVHGVVARSDIALEWLARPRDLLQVTVAELLTGTLRPRVTAETSVHRAAEIMLESRRDALPVLDDDGSLVGVLTHRDILAAVAHGDRTLPATPPENHSSPGPVATG